MRGNVVVVGLGLVGLAGAAQAQSLNLSLSNNNDPPSADYAAAGGAGVWNSASGIANQSFDMVDTTGAASHISMSQSPTTTWITNPDTALTGNDSKLLNNGLQINSTGPETCVSFYGVDPGDYEVIIYAWTPNQPGTLSLTRQDAPDEGSNTKLVGGAYHGGQEEGVTYARYFVTVGANGVLPVHSGVDPGMPASTFNGVQFRPLTPAISDAGPTGIPPDDGGGGGGSIDAGPGGGGGGGGETSDGGTASSHHDGGCAAGSNGAGAGMLLLGLAATLRRRRR